MEIQGSTALVTGANRGIGAEFVRQLTARGARKVHATARQPGSVAAEGVDVLALDVTDRSQIDRVARQAQDVDLLVNNAGIALGASLVDGPLADIRRELEVNVFGPLMMARAMAPALAANGGGAILNVVSAAGWLAAPGATTYAMSKAAAWILTDGLRLELAGQGTQVTSVQMALVDTAMTAHLELAKSSPATVVSQALDGVESGAAEVVADAVTADVKAGLGLDPAERYRAFLALT